MKTTFSCRPDAPDAADDPNLTRGLFLPLTVDDGFAMFDWCLSHEHAGETRKVAFIEVTIHWQDE